jgi:hypothetical protein
VHNIAQKAKIHELDIGCAISIWRVAPPASDYLLFAKLGSGWSIENPWDESFTRGLRQPLSRRTMLVENPIDLVAGCKATLARCLEAAIDPGKLCSCGSVLAGHEAGIDFKLPLRGYLAELNF